MKRFLLIVFAIILCISAVSCKNQAPAEETTEAATEAEVKDDLTPVLGDWVCKIKLSDAMTEANHSVWSKDIAGDYVVTLQFNSDGTIAVSADMDKAVEAVRQYLLGSYDESAAELAAKHHTKALSLKDKYNDVTYKVEDNKVVFSNGARLAISDGGKALIPDGDSLKVCHTNEGDDCQWFNTVISQVKFERV